MRDTKQVINQILEGASVREAMLQATIKDPATGKYSDVEFEDPWKKDKDQRDQLPKCIGNNPDIDVHPLTDKDVDLIVKAMQRKLDYAQDEGIKKVDRNDYFVEFNLQPQYGPAYWGLFGVINLDGYPDVYNSDGSSIFRDYMEENGLTQADVNFIRKG